MSRFFFLGFDLSSIFMDCFTKAALLVAVLIGNRQKSNKCSWVLIYYKMTHTHTFRSHKIIQHLLFSSGHSSMDLSHYHSRFQYYPSLYPVSNFIPQLFPANYLYFNSVRLRYWLNTLGAKRLVWNTS